MVPADKVATCEPTDSVKYVLDTMLQRRIGAIVVLVPGKYKIPIGLITKSDLLMAYASRVPMNRPAKEIMTKDIDTVKESMSRDQAARVLTRNRNHHAIVVDENEHFKGIISTWDIVVECAKDDQAWRKWWCARRDCVSICCMRCECVCHCMVKQKTIVYSYFVLDSVCPSR